MTQVNAMRTFKVFIPFFNNFKVKDAGVILKAFQSTSKANLLR